MDLRSGREPLTLHRVNPSILESFNPSLSFPQVRTRRRITNGKTAEVQLKARIKELKN
jgi:hypothetical protein